MRLAALLLLVSLTGLAQARPGEACTDAVEAALRAVDRKAKIPGDVAASECRPWPAAPGRITAAVMAFEKPRSGDLDREWQVVIALVDPARGKALSSHRVSVQEDATTFIGPSSLSLDLAPYLLRPGVRALGLRFSSDQYNRSANSRTGSPLRLYVPEGLRLRPVFCQAMGWQDAGSGVIGQDAWDEAQTTLSLVPRQTQGWQDLRLTEQIGRHTPDGEASKPTPSHRECHLVNGVYGCAAGRADVSTDCDPAGL